MKQMPKFSLDFIKNNKQLLFTFLIIIMIPGLMVLNTYLLFSSMQKNIDKELQYKAISIAEGLNVLLFDKLDNPSAIQDKIVQYQAKVDNVKSISVLDKQNEDFVTIASINKEEIGNKIDSNDTSFYVLSWYQNEAIATYRAIGTERYWMVNMPLTDKDGNKKLIANVWVSLTDIDNMMSGTQMTAIWILLASVVVVILLLVSNSRLYEFSLLYTKLREVDQMKDDFISVASHELRTPLTAIKGYLSMILDEETKNKLSTAEKNKMLLGAASSTDRLSGLVSDILDVSRIEQGRITLNMESYNISEMVDKVVDGLKLEAEKKGLKIIEHYAKSNVNALVDKDKFSQIIINLVGNAIKYSREGEIEISVENETGNIKIVVRDTGIGMDEEERKNLFTKFYRVQNDDTKDIVGTGLGLWITKQLVESMNGKIMVDSIKEVGSQFTVLIPEDKSKKKE